MLILDPLDPQHQGAIAEIWTSACGNCYAASPEFVRYNLTPVAGVNRSGCIAQNQKGAMTGFVSASILTNDPSTSLPTHGWIDAIAVRPEYQGNGYGDALLTWAEEWLVSQGCTRTTLGASIRTFVPGLPPELLCEEFFTHRGYSNSPNSTRNLIWDVASDLSDYETSANRDEIDGIVRAGKHGDEGKLISFLQREFPGRWRYETNDFLANGGRISDFMLLWTPQGIYGFCWLTFEDSMRPMERYYPYGLPRPWGQLGPIGVSKDCRGNGYGAAILDAGLRRLRDNGVRGCVIDWTNLVDFYAKFGFSRYREYIPLTKTLR